MNVNSFIDFVAKNLDVFDKTDIKNILDGEYMILSSRLQERFAQEKEAKKRKQLLHIAEYLQDFLEEYRQEAYKFDYNKSTELGHFLYWFGFYIKNNLLTRAAETLVDIRHNFPKETKILEKCKQKLDKHRGEYTKEFALIKSNIEKTNKLKKVELLMTQWEYGQAQYEALKFLDIYPDDKDIKYYIKRIDQLKSNNINETIDLNKDFFEKVWLLQLSKKENLHKNDFKEIYKKLKHLQRVKDFESWIALIRYIKEKFSIEDKNFAKYYNIFLDQKGKIIQNRQREEYKLEIKSLNLLLKNKQYKEANIKATGILKKYPLIEKKEVFKIINKIDREKKQAVKYANRGKFEVWFEEIQISMAKLSKKWLYQFYEKMAWFLKARIDLKLALQIVYSQSKDLGLKRFVREVLDWIDSWMKLSEIFRWQPKIAKMDVALVRIWESTWKLWDIFESLLQTYKENDQRAKKIKSVMIYPSIVFTLTIALFAALLIFIMPKFVTFYGQVWVSLPAITVFMLAASDFLINQWPILIVWIVGFFFFVKALSYTTIWKYIISYVVLRIPIVKTILYKKYIIYFSKYLSLLLKSWVSLLEAMDLIILGTSNILYLDEYRRIRFELESWATFAKAVWLGQLDDISSYNNYYIPIDLAYAIDTWEKTWQLWSLLEEVAERYDYDLQFTIKNLQSLMEPFILIIVWWMVFVFVLSVFLPLINVYSVLGKMWGLGG